VLVVGCTGAMRWVQTLNWSQLDDYNSADRETLINPDTLRTEAYVRAYDRFKFYWILGAGHSVIAGFSVCLRLRNDLYCVEWGVKLYSLTRHVC